MVFGHPEAVANRVFEHRADLKRFGGTHTIQGFEDADLVMFIPPIQIEVILQFGATCCDHAFYPAIFPCNFGGVDQVVLHQQRISASFFDLDAAIDIVKRHISRHFHFLYLRLRSIQELVVFTQETGEIPCLIRNSILDQLQFILEHNRRILREFFLVNQVGECFRGGWSTPQIFLFEVCFELQADIEVYRASLTSGFALHE